MGDIRTKNGDLDMGEIKTMLKKLATILMLDGLRETDTEKITLSNSLGIIMGTLDLGPQYYLDLVKALAPQSQVIAEQIRVKNPRLSDLHAVKPSELFTKEGGIHKDALTNLMLNQIDIRDVLKDTGASSSDDATDDFVFEPKR